MSIFLKSAVVGLGLVAGIATAAPAQTVSAATPGTSIASLPQPGPRASSYNAIQGPAQQVILPSGVYPGPAPGAGTGQMPPHFEKSADWNANTALHPYDNGIGPRPN